MITMSWFTYVVGVFFVSFFSTYLYKKLTKKKIERSIGELFVNPFEPVDQGGVYAAFDVDPTELEDGQQVYMTVKIVRK